MPQGVVDYLADARSFADPSTARHLPDTVVGECLVRSHPLAAQRYFWSHHPQCIFGATIFVMIPVRLKASLVFPEGLLARCLAKSSLCFSKDLLASTLAKVSLCLYRSLLACTPAKASLCLSKGLLFRNNDPQRTRQVMIRAILRARLLRCAA